MSEKNYGARVEGLSSQNEQGEKYLDIGQFLNGLDLDSLDLLPALDINKYEPTFRAEVLWSLYREINTSLGLKTKEQKIEMIKNDRKLQMKLSTLQKLWADDETKKLFQKEYNRHLKEEKTVNGEYEEYQNLTKDMAGLQQQIDDLLVTMFASRGREISEMDSLLYDSYLNSYEQKKQDLDTLLSDNPELAARAAYNKLLEYQRQLQKEHFIWTNSRLAIYRELSQKMLSGRPVMILSESGAGKTSLVSALAKHLTGQRVSRVVGGKNTRAEKLFATHDLSGDTSYYRYQPIVEALSGKASSLDSKPKHKGRVCLDDEFNQRPADTQMEIIKNLSGNVIPGEEFQVPNTTLTEKVQSNFAFVACGNPASDRYERNDTDVAVLREFAGNIIEMDYLEQTKNNPELYQVMLASLLDKNHRIRVAEDEVSPQFIWQDENQILDENPQAGGFLWRFANAWRTMYDSFKHEDNALSRANPGQPKEEFFLDKVLLDVGVVTSWLEKYKKIKVDSSLENFLRQELQAFLAQPTFSQEDRDLVNKILQHFAIDLDKQETKVMNSKVLTPQDIGWLLPNVARPRKEKIGEAETHTILSDEGEEIEYTLVKVFDYQPGTKFQSKHGKKQKFTLVGKSKEGNAVLKDESDQTAVVIGVKEELLEDYEEYTPPQPEGLSLETAEQILTKEKVFGPDDVRQVWGVELDKVPPIPYSQADLEKAKKMGMYLILRLDKDGQGNPLTAKRMNDLKQAEFTRNNRGKILYNAEDWYKNEEFFIGETPKLSWTLTSGDILPGSTNNNYVHQTRILRDHLKSQGWLSQKEERDCSDEVLRRLSNEMGVDFDTQRIIDESKYNANWRKVTEDLIKLSINQKYRPSFAEVLYDFISILESKNKRILESIYTWTKSRSSSGFLVEVGRCGGFGANVRRWEPDVQDFDLGASFSR